jgi:hypothetical protein
MDPIGYQYCLMIRGLFQQVYVYFSQSTTINPGRSHASENRHEILCRSVDTSLIFEPWVIEISQQVFVFIVYEKHISRYMCCHGNIFYLANLTAGSNNK